MASAQTKARDAETQVLAAEASSDAACAEQQRCRVAMDYAMADAATARDMLLLCMFFFFNESATPKFPTSLFLRRLRCVLGTEPTVWNNPSVNTILLNWIETNDISATGVAGSVPGRSLIPIPEPRGPERTSFAAFG